MNTTNCGCGAPATTPTYFKVPMCGACFTADIDTGNAADDDREPRLSTYDEDLGTSISRGLR